MTSASTRETHPAETSTDSPGFLVHLCSGGVSVAVGPDEWGHPALLHWGASLSDADVESLHQTSRGAVLNSSLDRPRAFSLVPSRFHGWSGTPSIEWGEQGARGRALQLDMVEATGFSARFDLSDDSSSITLSLRIEQAGAVVMSTSVTNRMTLPLELGAVRNLLPLPQRASELLDFTGRWSGERRPQRRSVADGTWLRTSRRGRPGHDTPYLSMAGTPGFTYRTGEIWACHLAWSGNQEVIVERLPEGAGVHSSVIGAAEHLDRGEVTLQPGETYTTPDTWFVWGDEGVDSVSERLHASIREFPSYPRTPRPLVLNTWEAVYFEHSPDRLEHLARLAAQVGVERFVLDDGWFEGRRHDAAGLGDWTVDLRVWPEGLRPLSDTVHNLGMQFGLWFEPEMVNPDSDLARQHPDWLLGETPELTSRNQFALDFAHPEAYAKVLHDMDSLVSSVGIDFIKWDHNRDLHAAWHSPSGRTGVHSHTMAVYRLIDELRRRHPALEIESCASGGARPDLGMLSRTQRVWASDTNDPIERQPIQSWTQTLLPPELVGSHVGPTTAHTTGRATDLNFRFLTSLFGHAGLEWDLTACTQEELARIAAWSSVYKELRPLLHSGVVVRADNIDSGAVLHGVVSPDKSHAVFAWVRTATSATAHTARVQLPGLDEHRRYTLRLRDELGDGGRHQVSDPPWLAVARAGVTFSGGALGKVGVPLPLLNPGSGILLDLRTVA